MRFIAHKESILPYLNEVVAKRASAQTVLCCVYMFEYLNKYFKFPHSTLTT